MNFFGMGPMEIAVIMVVALIIFGPGRLPEIGAAIGKGIRDFKAATSELTGEFERTINEVEGAANEVKQSAKEVQNTTMGVTRLDQMDSGSAATQPKRPLPSAGAGQPVQSDRLPTKADPLADLMVGEAVPATPENGHVASEEHDTVIAEVAADNAEPSAKDEAVAPTLEPERSAG